MPEICPAYTTTIAEIARGDAGGAYPGLPYFATASIHKNAAGEIFNLFFGGLVDVKSIAIIDSEPGSLRSNHYHKTDWHILVLLSGSIDYYWRTIGSRESTRVQMRAADLNGCPTAVFTPPLIEHAVYTPTDGKSRMLSLAKHVRTDAEHEADLVRVNFVQIANGVPRVIQGSLK